MSKKQTNGGFLQFLLSIGIGIAKALGVGAASGVGTWAFKKALDKATGKGLRHPFEKKGSGCLKKRQPSEKRQHSLPKKKKKKKKKSLES